MKLYIHWEGDQPFTKIFKTGDNGNVSELRDACWAALIARHPGLTASGPGALVLRGSNRRPLLLSARLGDALTNGDDVFYQFNASAVRTGGHPPTSSAGQAAGAAGSSSTAGAPKGSVSPPLSDEQDASLVSDGAASPAPPAALQAGGQSRGTPEAATEPAQNGGGSKLHGRCTEQPASTNTSTSTREALVPVVRTLWLRAEELAAQLHYRAAGEALQQALLLVPEPSSPTHIATLVRLARMWLSAGNPAAAVQWALRTAQEKPGDPCVLELAGDCLREGGRPREAAAQYQSALEALQEGEGEGEEAAAVAVARAPLVGQKERGYGGEESQEASGGSSPASAALLRLRLSLAACLVAVPGNSISPPYDNQDLAASLVMAVLERDPGHWEALRLYARIALDRGLREDALKVALRLVVGRPKHAGAKALLAECLPDEASCRMLYDELGFVLPDQQPGGATATSAATAAAAVGANSTSGSSSIAAALAFVATAVKDFGKVDTCIALLQRAVQLDPTNPSYCLNLVHALELRQDLQAAVEAGRSYCRRCGTQLAGRSLRDVDALLFSLPELRHPLQLTWYEAEQLWGSAASPRPEPPSRSQAEAEEEGQEPGGRGPGGGVANCVSGGSGGIGGEGGEGGRPGGRFRGGAWGDSAAAAADGAPGRAPAPPPAKISYSSDQLDELALLFTLAKVLFVGGALTAAAKLCELVDPMRSACAVELHTTLIRNEAAYFGCVVQLLNDDLPPPARPLPLPPIPPSSLPLPDTTATAVVTATASNGASPSGSAPSPLYLCGDSHCLSAAWRLVTLRGEQRLLRPLLVTGCKVWHLRRASEFYPKKQFEITIRQLPDGAQVVLVLGEIDCREGLLLAVQKGKYDSVAEGIDATVTIYMEVLRHMVSRRAMEVFVHPVPPVLNETRRVVTAFNAALRAAVGAARQADPTLRQRLHYLDFFDRLLVPRLQQEQQQQGAAAASTNPMPTSFVSSALSASGLGSSIGAAGASASPEAPLHTASAGGGPHGEVVSEGAVPGAAVRGRECPGMPGGAAVEGAAAAAAAATAAEWALRPDLAFDGTHLAPTYVKELDAALSEVPT